MYDIKLKETLRIFNSLSRKKEVFFPIIQNHIGLYVCGITVYKEIHIGNCRTIISLDLMIRYFRHLGYKVRYVRNITDIGHIENDINNFYDKITKKAVIECIEPMELAQKYTYDFHNILDKFNSIFPNIEPIASGHIIEQIEIIKILIKKGFAYNRNGSIYFDVLRYKYVNQYGILSSIDFKKSFILKNKKQKRNSLDFALWKQTYDSHIMYWPSPWGNGFPGWHLECTTMNTKYLGYVFDIHSGGVDLKFPHHECDISQAIALHGKIPVHFWIHTNMLTLNGKKMSKSLGNIIIPHNMFIKFSANVIRFFILQTHYRGNLAFTSKALTAAEKGYNRLLDAFLILEGLFISSIKGYISTLDIINWKQECYKAMNDDFNSSILIANLFESMHWIFRLLKGDEYITYYDLNILKDTMNLFFLEVLGLKLNFNKKIK